MKKRPHPSTIPELTPGDCPAGRALCVRLLILALISAKAAGAAEPPPAPTNNIPPSVALSPSVSLSLAAQLSSEGLHESAAAEYRRCAAVTGDPCSRAAFLWTAGLEYALTNRIEQAIGMLDRAEDSCDRNKDAVMLLRGRLALADRKQDEALYYFESVASDPEATPESREYAARMLAATHVRAGDLAGARRASELAPMSADRIREEITRRESIGSKSPRVGGLLGLIPGLGYSYSGEHANALRSFLLNGLFIYGLVDTAADEEWGAFAVISFFELTWYSGSIYGGIDAAHRWNRDRTEESAGRILGSNSFSSDRQALPLVKLVFSF